MATIFVQYDDGRPDNDYQGLSAHNLIQTARAVWTEEEHVALVLTCDGDPELLSSWTEVPREGAVFQPTMRQMKKWGMADDVRDDVVWE